MANIVTDFFLEGAKWVAETEGMPNASIIEIPHPLGGLPPEKIRERAQAVYEQVVEGLTQAKEGDREARKVTVRPEPEMITIMGRSNTEALKRVNDRFYTEKWTDGFPIVPPTPEAVEQMLKGTQRQPEEVIGLVPPRQGKASISNIAVNAVMAGAEPAYMPVIITAVEAVLDPSFAAGWGAGGMQATTSPATPFLIVNGPIAKELGIASGVDCLGRGHRANITIGRALRLVLTNIGGSQPGVNDMKCQGSAQEFTFCVAESEDHPVFHQGENPWRPLHVEKGYSPDTSTVTAFAAWIPICLRGVGAESIEHGGPDILNAAADSMASLGQVPYKMNWEYVLILSSTNAQRLADAGFSKDDIRNYLYDNTVMPWRKYKQEYQSLTTMLPSWMAHITDDETNIHIYGGPENVNVIVAGGEADYSQIVRANFTGVTRPIV